MRSLRLWPIKSATEISEVVIVQPRQRIQRFGGYTNILLQFASAVRMFFFSVFEWKRGGEGGGGVATKGLSKCNGRLGQVMC